MRQKPYRSYLESEVLSADPLRLVCLLYRCGIERIAEARECLRRHDIHGRGAAVVKAIAVVNQLVCSLDHERGAEISRNLVELYDYIARRIHEGNFRQNDAPLAEAEQLLRTLSEAWEATHAASAQDTSQSDYVPVSCAG